MVGSSTVTFTKFTDPLDMFYGPLEVPRPHFKTQKVVYSTVNS